MAGTQAARGHAEVSEKLPQARAKSAREAAAVPQRELEKREEQIGTRQDESQWIVAQRPLSAPTIPRFDWIVCPGFPRSMMWTSLNTDSFNGLQGTCDIRPKPFTFVPVLMERKTNTVYQHGF